ncbi:MAG: peroxidase family protein [Pirellulales bacterium]
MNARRKLHVERLEVRALLAADLTPVLGAASLATYSYDGTGNNLLHPDWGSAGSALLREAPAAYADGIASPAGANRPSAREISNALADQFGEDIVSDRNLSAMIYAWGQFIDHDLDLTPRAAPAESFNVLVPAGDPSFDPQGTGQQVIPLTRSLAVAGTGLTTPREQVNAITAWLDGSAIYGSSAATADALRTHSGGRLKTSAGDYLPYNSAEYFPDGALGMDNDAHRVESYELYATGDVRGNENVELTALHTLFLREHNYWADRIAAKSPGLSDEQIFQQARSIVIGELQAITYNEWLPAVLGRGALDPYRGYNPQVNPGIANEFSTAAFRFGHSLLGDDVEFLDNDGRVIGDEVPLSEAFFNPALVSQEGIDSILKYLASDPSSELDTKVVDSVRNFLFGPPGAGGLDLASLNIQRGRDHGLADYNSTRVAYGLPRVKSFAEITSDVQLQATLKELYGSVDNVDLWVGALAENHVPGSTVGPTLRAIISDQFERLRDGDRFWYQNVFSGSLLRQIDNTTLADVMRRNTELTNLQSNVFFFKASVSGTVFADADRDGRRDRGESPLAGLVVELVSLGENEVVATTTTDARGHYQFNVQSGLRTGDYQVRVVESNAARSSTERIVTTPLRTFAVTRGGESFDLDLGVSRLAPRHHPRMRPAPRR